MTTYREFHRRSIADRDAFWREEAALIDWQTPFASVLDYSKPPFAKWFVGGRTNLCHNAVDRHLAARGEPEGADLHLDRDRRDAHLHVSRAPRRGEPCSPRRCRRKGVARGDRVLIYMPMIAEAAFAMLACARIGAIHSVVFGGFAAASLATRIDDARPKAMVTSDAGMRGGKPVPYKHLVDEAMRLARAPAAARHHRQPRPRHGDADRRGPRRRLRRIARAPRQGAAFRASGSNRRSRRTSSTRRARRASRRACSATPAATRSRSPRRCGASSASRPARRCSRRATSAGSSVTRTSSTRRSSTARRRSSTRACRSAPIRRSGGRSSPTTRSGRCSARPPRSAC